MNSQYEGVRRDILKDSPTPPVDVAYGWVKREAIRQKIMSPANPTGASTGEAPSGGVGFGFGARNQRTSSQPAPPRQQTQHPAATNNRRGGANKPDKTKLWCSHCGMNKHTKETCFKLVGFPEWWDETQKGKARLAIGVEEAGGTEFNSRGRGTDGETPRGGSGRRGEEVGQAAFAGRVGGEESGGGIFPGGNGLGLRNPSPIYNFPASPSFLKKLHIEPHVSQSDPHSLSISKNDPILCDNAFLSPNRFEILHKLPIACTVQHKPSEKDTWWIFFIVGQLIR